MPGRSPAALIAKLVQRIREEFEEAPGLQLTVAEGARFWALDLDTCAAVLDSLRRSGFLDRSAVGRYHRACTI